MNLWIEVPLTDATPSPTADVYCVDASEVVSEPSDTWKVWNCIRNMCENHPKVGAGEFFIFFFCDLCECGGFTPIPWNECVPFVGGDNTSDFLSVLIQNSP